MLSTIGQWIITVPIDNPWRAIIVVLMVLAFAFILHLLWDLGFTLTGMIRQMIARIKMAENISGSRPYVVISAAQASEKINISPESDK